MHLSMGTWACTPVSLDTGSTASTAALDEHEFMQFDQEDQSMQLPALGGEVDVPMESPYGPNYPTRGCCE